MTYKNRLKPIDKARDSRSYARSHQKGPSRRTSANPMLTDILTSPTISEAERTELFDEQLKRSYEIRFKDEVPALKERWHVLEYDPTGSYTAHTLTRGLVVTKPKKSSAVKKAKWPEDVEELLLFRFPQINANEQMIQLEKKKASEKVKRRARREIGKINKQLENRIEAIDGEGNVYQLVHGLTSKVHRWCDLEKKMEENRRASKNAVLTN